MPLPSSWSMILRSSALPPMIATALALPLLLRGLDLDGFFAGDPGVRFAAAREAIAHPWRPLEVDLPSVNGTAAPAFVEWQFQVHGDHAHALASPLFPPLIAPFVALMGAAGAYVVPALGLVLLVPVMVALAGRLEIRGPRSLAGWGAVLLSPLLFYALECWEHVPAVLAVALAWLLTLPDGTGRIRPAAAGLAMAGAIVLRPEAAWSALALGASLVVSRARRRGAIVFGSTVLAALLPAAVAAVAHFGSPFGPHLTANADLLRQSWGDARIGIARAWLFTWDGRDSLWIAFPAALLAFAAPPVTPLTRTLWFLVLAPVAGTILTAPNTGGAQWGPRYLLGVVPPILLLAQHGSVGLLQRRRPARWLVATAMTVVIGAGLAATRSAYRTLRGSKRLHAEIARAMASPFEPYVVTDLWWLDQLAASTTPRPTFLYVRDRAALDRLVAALAEGGVRRFVSVQGEESAGPIWRDGWEGSYRLAAERRLAVRKLRLLTFVRAP